MPLSWVVQGLLWVGGAAGVVLGVIIVITVISVSAIRHGLKLTPLDPNAHPALMPPFQTSAQWAAGQGFGFVGLFSTRVAGSQVSLFAWRHEKRPTYFVMYVIQDKITYDFVAVFNGYDGLTTGTTRDGQFLPKSPGDYTQTFEKRSLDELFNLHAASEWFLINKGGVQVQASDLSFEQAISMSCINQSAYIRSLPLWPLRAPYWFFIRRRTYHGKTVEQLQREGKIILPNDPRFKPFQTRI